MDKVVVSIGGSVLIPGNNDSEYIARLADVLLSLKDRVQLAVVVGGGRTARYYASTGRNLGGSDRQLDIMGIGATRLNAQLLGLALGNMPERVPESAEETAASSRPGTIAVMGGTEPGHTTDAVAMMVARAMKADRVVNATSVDAVYTADPRLDPDAQRIPRMDIARLGEIVYKDHHASKSSVFDPLGVEIARECRIDISMVDGRNLEELEKAILGEEFQGTFVDSHRAARRIRNRRPRGLRMLLCRPYDGPPVPSWTSGVCTPNPSRTPGMHRASSGLCRRHRVPPADSSGSCGRNRPCT